MADSGVLERVHHGVYRVARFPHDEHQDLRVAWLALDPERVAWERLDDDVPTGVASHRTAAALHGLGDLDADVTELTAVRRIRLSLPDVEVRRGHLTRQDWQVVDGLPVTTPLRTIADLAAVGIDRGHLAGIVRDAVAREAVGIGAVVEVLAEHAFAYGFRAFDGKGMLDSLVEEAGVPENARVLAEITQRQGRLDRSKRGNGS